MIDSTTPAELRDYVAIQRLVRLMPGMSEKRLTEVETAISRERDARKDRGFQIRNECPDCGGCGELGYGGDCYHCPRCQGAGDYNPEPNDQAKP